MSKIDRSRGCAIRKHRQGFRVVMYYDDPGVYFDEVGKSISEDMAREAGFDIETHAAERKKHQTRKSFEKRLAAGLADDEAGLTLAPKGDLKVVPGRKKDTFQIVDAKGGLVTKTAMTADEAAITFKAITGKRWAPPAVKTPVSNEPDDAGADDDLT